LPARQARDPAADGAARLRPVTGDTPRNQLMAVTTLTVIPVLILFVLAQRTFIRGIATTGLKGVGSAVRPTRDLAEAHRRPCVAVSFGCVYFAKALELAPWPS
jgi:hypothetical protein